MAEASWVKHNEEYRLMAGAVSIAIVFPVRSGYEWRMSLPRPMPGKTKELRTKGYGRTAEMAMSYARSSFEQWCNFAGADAPDIDTTRVIDAQSYWSSRDH